MSIEIYLESFKQAALKAYRALDIDKYFPKTIYRKAVYYYKAGDFVNAVDMLEDCLTLRSTLGYNSHVCSSEERASCASYLADIHLYGKLGLKDEMRAGYYLEVAAELSDAPILQKNAGGFFLFQRSFDRAMPYLKNCLESDYDKHFGPEQKAYCTNWLGVIHTIPSSGFYDLYKALAYHTMSLELDPYNQGHINAINIVLGKIADAHDEL